MNKKIINIIQLLISLVSFFLILKILKEENEYNKILLSSDFFSFIPAVIISVTLIFLYCFFIRGIIISTTPLQINKFRWAQIFLNSQFFNTIPYIGFFYRGLKLKKYDLDIGNYIYSYLFILWIWSIVILAFFSLEFTGFYFIFLNINFLKTSIFLLILLVIIFSTIKMLHVVLRNFHFKFLVMVNKIFLFCNKFFTKKNLLHVIKFAIPVHIFEFCLFYFVIKFLGLKVDLIEIFVIFAINNIIDLFPITPQNLGFSELMGALILNFFGFSLSTGILVKLFVRLSNIIAITLLFSTNNVLRLVWRK